MSITQHTVEKDRVMRASINLRLTELRGEFELLAYKYLNNTVQYSADEYEQFCKTELNKILLDNVKTNL